MVARGNGTASRTTRFQPVFINLERGLQLSRSAQRQPEAVGVRRSSIPRDPPPDKLCRRFFVSSFLRFSFCASQRSFRPSMLAYGDASPAMHALHSSIGGSLCWRHSPLGPGDKRTADRLHRTPLMQQSRKSARPSTDVIKVVRFSELEGIQQEHRV